MKILVTGASGFIGSNQIPYLRRNHEVISVDIQEPLFHPADEFIMGDICDYSFLEEVFKKYQPDVVIHLAAVSTIQGGWSEKEKTERVNVEGTRNVLRAMKAAGNQCVLIYASTDKVYGNMDDAGSYTESMKINPVKTSPYDYSKAKADQMVREWSDWNPGSGFIILRFCNLYGPYDLHTSRIVPGTIFALLSKTPGVLRKYYDENGTLCNYYRDMLYIDDLCRVIDCLIDCLDSEKRQKLLGEVFNVGSEQCVSMEEVWMEIRNLLHVSDLPREEYVKESSEITRQHMECLPAKRILGLNPSVSLSEGLEKTICWWKHYLKEIMLERR